MYYMWSRVRRECLSIHVSLYIHLPFHIKCIYIHMIKGIYIYTGVSCIYVYTIHIHIPIM